MTDNTTSHETIGYLLTQLRADLSSESVAELRHDIIARFTALEQERDALRARLSSLAGTKNPLADELQSAQADLAAARAEIAQLTEQLRQMKEDHAYLDKHAQTYFDESQFMRDLILAAMRGER